MPAAAQPGSAEPRIVSLSPAISRTLADLGLEHHVVGRSPYCHALDPAIPAVGDLLNISYEQLVRLNPTHVLVQPPAAGVDPQLATLAADRGWTIGRWRLEGLSDIRTMVSELPATILHRDSERFAAATSRAEAIVARIDASLRPDAGIFTGRSLLLSSVDPPMAFGAGTYLHELLIGLGGRNAIEASGWVQLSMEDAARAAPEAIIIVQPSAADSLPCADSLELLAKVSAAAAHRGRMAVLRHPDGLLPCSTVSGVADELRAILRSFAGQPP